MYDRATRESALRLVGQGRSLNSVSKETGISRAALRDWQRRIEPKRGIDECIRCMPVPQSPRPRDAYAYLLGLYLGDGCISSYKRDVYALRIACADAWPGLMDDCEDAIRTVRPGSKVCRQPRQGCHMVTSYWKHWPCLFPQHGPGRKHERSIELAGWQQEIVDEHPWDFVRGLVHSDGCRVTNWTIRTVGGQPKRYEYPRYFFTNQSKDILGMFTAALDLVDIEWRFNRGNNVSVAKRASVQRMDVHIGPKY